MQVVGERVLQRVPGEQRAEAKQRLERHHVVRFAPCGHELRVVRLTGVVADGDAGIVGQPPEVVEHRIAGRAHAHVGRDRSRDHHDEACVALQRPLEFTDRVVRLAQRDVRGAEDPLLVGESPVLVHPAVEGAEGGRRRVEVGQQRLLHPDAEGRQHDGALHALFVHQLPAARRGRGTRGRDRLQVAEQRVQVRASRVAAAEVLVERAGLSDRDRRSGSE